MLAAGPYYPQFCLSVLTALVETSGVNEGRETAMLEDIQGFNTAVGTCEKVRGQRVGDYMGAEGSEGKGVVLAEGLRGLSLYPRCGEAAAVWAVCMAQTQRRSNLACESQ